MAAWLLTAGMAAQGEAYAAHVAPGFFREWTREAVRRLGLRGGERVLDVACGAGGAAREAALLVGPRGRVVGLDASGPMLAAARRRSSRPSWTQADAHALPFADASFDRVSCPHGLMFFDDAAGALAEMARVLRPGGRLVATAWGAPARNPHERAMAEAFGRELGEEPPFFRRLFALSGDADLLALAGTVRSGRARVERVRRVARFASAASYWEGLARGRPIAALLDEMPTDAVARIRAGTLARLRRYECGAGYVCPMEALVLTLEAPA